MSNPNNAGGGFSKQNFLENKAVTFTALRFNSGSTVWGPIIVPSHWTMLNPPPETISKILGVLMHTRGVRGWGCQQWRDRHVQPFSDTVVFLGTHGGRRLFEVCSNCLYNSIQPTKCGAVLWNAGLPAEVQRALPLAPNTVSPIPPPQRRVLAYQLPVAPPNFSPGNAQAGLSTPRDQRASSVISNDPFVSLRSGNSTRQTNMTAVGCPLQNQPLDSNLSNYGNNDTGFGNYDDDHSDGETDIGITPSSQTITLAHSRGNRTIIHETLPLHNTTPPRSIWSPPPDSIETPTRPRQRVPRLNESYVSSANASRGNKAINRALHESSPPAPVSDILPTDRWTRENLEQWISTTQRRLAELRATVEPHRGFSTDEVAWWERRLAVFEQAHRDFTVLNVEQDSHSYFDRLPSGHSRMFTPAGNVLAQFEHHLAG